MKLITLLSLVGLVSGCGGRIGLDVVPGPEPDASPLVTDAAVESAGDAAEEDPFDCEGYDNQAPPSLECTGLYANWSRKELARGVREYAPATPLWSDGADKLRWVYLPLGATIDATSRSDWVFPVGTKFWKEFRLGGKRIETRLFEKLRSDRWVTAAYAWSDDESSTTSSMGGDQSNVDLGGGLNYHIATQKECSDCHKGRQDRILGFEEVSLGTPGATGLTLSVLVREGLLSPAPPAVDLRIPDDGTGAAASALAWIHVNCGVTCHNRNSAATGNGTKMFLRLDPAEFGTAASEWDLLSTTVSVNTITPAWFGETRILPGSPERSLLVRLISSRGGEQMPPIGTHLVDQRNVDLVKEWIRRMPTGGPDDGGGADAGPDASVDVSMPNDGAAPDVNPPDAPDKTDDASSEADASTDGDASSEANASPDADASPDAAEDGAGHANSDAGIGDAGPGSDASNIDTGSDAASDPDSSE